MNIIIHKLYKNVIFESRFWIFQVWNVMHLKYILSLAPTL